MSGLIQLGVDGGVAIVRLNRPDKLNALLPTMFAALVEAIAALERRVDVRVVVLAGEGRAFSAGLDLSALAGGGVSGTLIERTHGDANALQQVAWGWRTLGVPVIAAVQGAAFGAGCQIALGADIRIAGPAAELSLMEIRWGIVPDLGGFALLRGLVRDDHARELIYTGRRVGAEEAERIGLMTRLADDPIAEAMALARAIAAQSPAAVRAAKRLMNMGGGSREVLLAESAEQEALLVSAGHREAMRAAVEKRAPVFDDWEG